LTAQPSQAQALAEGFKKLPLRGPWQAITERTKENAPEVFRPQGRFV
jgi:hypothetical protein